MKVSQPEHISFLIRFVLNSDSNNVFYYVPGIISTVQNRCKFYNYEIWQATIQHKEQALLAGQPTPLPTDLLAKIDKAKQQIDRRTQHMVNELKNNFSGATFNGPVNFGDNPTGDFIGTQNNYSENICPSIHMSLGGQHQGWGGTDTITVNLQNEGFCSVQLLRCSVHWKPVDGSARYELKPNMQIRWIQKVPWKDVSGNFVLPNMLKPGYIIQVSFDLTPQDIQASEIDISKYVESLGNELMASSIVYEAFAEVRTESNHVMSGSTSFFYPRDKDKRLSVLLK